MTLACKDANLKLVEVVTVADVDDENRVGNNLLQISHSSRGSQLFSPTELGNNRTTSPRRVLMT